MDSFKEYLDSIEDESKRSEVEKLFNSTIEKKVSQKISEKDEEINSLKSQMDKISKQKNEDSKKGNEDMNNQDELFQKIDNLQKLYEEEKNKRVEKEQEFEKSKIKNTLKEKIGDKFYGSDAIIENSILKGDLKMEDNKIISKDGRDLDSYIENISEQYKDALIPKQKSGNNNVVKDNDAGGEKSFAQKVKERMRNKI